MNNIQLIVVANGCTDNTREYLDSLGSLVETIWFDDAIGYTKATNAGIKRARGEYVILLNNDTVILGPDWIELLENPFNKKDTGITGPVKFIWDCGYNQYECMAFWLVMMKKSLFDEIGLLDEKYSPGMGEDGDFCIRATNAGYKLVSVPENVAGHFDTGIVSNQYPIYHVGNGTFSDNTELKNEIIERNKKLLIEQYGNKRMKKYSIVIPTYNHCDDLLKPCIESIIKYSDMDDIQLIVVANGCTDNTKEYLDSLGSLVETIWVNDAIGYTKATNMGILASKGEFTILLNNDTELLQQHKNRWLDQLKEPMKNPKVAMTGPLMLHDDYSDADVLIFFCVMIRTTVFSEIGILDEIFSPGGGEDIDFSVRLKQAGYKITNICDIEYVPEQATNVGNFPIWHKNNQTFKDIPEYTKHIVKRNGLINCKRYNKNIRLNVGSAGIDYPGFLSVDLYDQRAHVIMDITNLDFEENSVEEILASHVFEHLNPYHALDILKRWLSVLKPGGKLVMEMPDIQALCRRFANATTISEKYGILNAVYGSVNTTNVGGPDQITSPHLFGWWDESLYEHLSVAGFVNIQFMDEKIPHPESNLRVEAYKPNLENKTLVDHATLKKQEPITYKEIFEQNGYMVESDDLRDKIVIDVGSNLGMFSILAAEQGAKRVIAVEAEPTIYEYGLLQNVKTISTIEPMFYAVYDSDDKKVTLENKHVASKVVGETTIGTPTITLKTLLEKCKIIENDLILKLDCEGSEFNILYSCDSSTLDRFSKIFIEIHGECNSNSDERYRKPYYLRHLLSDHGFKREHSFEQKQNNIPMGVFVEKWVKCDNE